VANELAMADVQAILTLHRTGWSCRRIASELKVHRETVGRHVALAEAAGSRPARNPPHGSGASRKADPAGEDSVRSGEPSRSMASGRGNGVDSGRFFGAARPPDDPVAAGGSCLPGRGVEPSGTEHLLGRSRPGEPGPASECKRWRGVVLAKLEEGRGGAFRQRQQGYPAPCPGCAEAGEDMKGGRTPASRPACFAGRQVG